MKRHFEDYKEIKSYSPNTAISHTFRFFSPRKTLFACFVEALPTPECFGFKDYKKKKKKRKWKGSTSKKPLSVVLVI